MPLGRWFPSSSPPSCCESWCGCSASSGGAARLADVHEDAGGWTLVLARGGVRDLSAGARGTLIATGAGLYEWPASAEEPRSLPLGAGARVHAVAATAGGEVWVASEVGLFARAPEARHFRRVESLPAGEVRAVRALAEEIWAATRGTLWSGRDPLGFEPRLKSLATGWWELRDVARVPSGTLVAVPRGLWHLPDDPGAAGVPTRIELGLGELRALAWVGERLWVASERGVYTLQGTAPDLSRSEVVVDREAFAVELASRGLLVATPDGVGILPLTPARAPAFSVTDPGRGQPDVLAVQRAVLAYLELSPARVAQLEARSRRAAWLPELRATWSLERDKRIDRDHDQSFSSGEVRNLFDRTRESDVGYSVDVRLVWELSKLASPDDALAVSRERRQLVELRDQVLERVNRLYFERVRVLGSLASLAPDARERAEAELRMSELTAHLNAWTGGLFSRLDADPPPSQRRP